MDKAGNIIPICPCYLVCVTANMNFKIDAYSDDELWSCSGHAENVNQSGVRDERYHVKPRPVKSLTLAQASCIRS